MLFLDFTYAVDSSRKSSRRIITKNQLSKTTFSGIAAQQKSQYGVCAARGQPFSASNLGAGPNPARITEVARRATLGGTCSPYEMGLHGRRPARFLRRAIGFHDAGCSGSRVRASRCPGAT